MGLLNKLRNELVDIIEYIDDSRTTLAWRFPRYQNEIKNGAQLIVREGQRAVLVYRGNMADQFEPGNYTLDSENLPILSTLQGWKYGFDSPFRSEVYFINTRVTLIRWGTPTPVVVRDPDFKMVEVRANGTCQVRVADTAIFLREVIGTDSTVDAEEITELLRQVIIGSFSTMIMDTGMGVIDLQSQQQQLAEKLKEYINERVDDEFGLDIPAVDLKISLPEEIRQALLRGTARGAEESQFLDQVGDLDRYTKAKAADAMMAAAQNEGGGGSMGDIMGLGVGMAMANTMAQSLTQSTTPSAAASAAPPPLPGQATQYHVALNGQQAGPFTMDSMRAGLAGGQMQPDSLVWAPHLSGWMPANTVPELAPLFAAPPPLPTNPPPVPPMPPAAPAGE
ncbi:MAG: SPFH domain-containing protein [Acidimicrobiales bacterium]